MAQTLFSGFLCSETLSKARTRECGHRRNSVCHYHRLITGPKGDVPMPHKHEQQTFMCDWTVREQREGKAIWTKGG